MHLDHKTYLKNLGIPRLAFERVQNLYQLCQSICPEKITGIFVTNSIDPGGTQDFQDLWFFSEKYCLECKGLKNQTDYAITPIKNRILYLRVSSQDYDHNHTTKESMMKVSFRLNSNFEGEIQAAGENCNHLQEILKKHLLPNLIRQ